MSDGCDGRREENDVQQSASFNLKALLFSFLVEFDDQEAVSASQLVFLFFFVLGMVAEFILKTWGDQ